MKLKPLLCVLILLCVFLCPTWVQADPATFGETSSDCASGTPLENHIFGGRFIAPSSGTLDSMSYTTYTIYTDVNVRYAVYEWIGTELPKKGGSMGAPIDTVAEFLSGEPTYEWSQRTQPFVNNASIEEGKLYLMVGWADEYFQAQFTSSASPDSGYDYNVAYGAWPQDLGVSGSRGDWLICVYCFYTEEAPPEEGQVIIIGDASNFHRPPRADLNWREE